MESEVVQKRKLALQYGKFNHVVTKINQTLRTNSEIEELETWKDRLNLVATNYDILLMETVALIENDDERDNLTAQQLIVDDQVVELRTQLETEIRQKTASQRRTGTITPPGTPGTGSKTSAAIQQGLPIVK